MRTAVTFSTLTILRARPRPYILRRAWRSAIIADRRPDRRRARRGSPSGWPSRIDGTAVLEDTENPFLADFYNDRPGRGAAGAAVLPAQSPSPADGAAAGRSVPAHDGLRLPVRPRQDLRVSESRRQRAVHLSAALRPARARHPAARSRRLSAGADRRAAAPRERDSPPIPSGRCRSPTPIPARAERGVSAFLLPLHRHAAAGRRDVAVRTRTERRRARRPSGRSMRDRARDTATDVRGTRATNDRATVPAWSARFAFRSSIVVLRPSFSFC